MEQKKTKRNRVLEDGEDRTNVRITDIQFAYDNHELIGLLKLRGAAITALNFDKMRETDELIKQMV